MKPFRDFNVPIFAKNRQFHRFLCSKGMGFQSIWHIQKVICVLQWKSDKVTANDFSLEIGSNKSPLFKVQWDAQVVDMSSLTPLEDANGDQVSSKGWGISIGIVFVFVDAGLFSELSCLCFCNCFWTFALVFFILCFFHVALGDNASFEFLKLSRCSVFCF